MLMDRFEKLAKDMAGMSRRDALRRVGGGLAGAMLAAFGIGTARAWQEGGGEDNPCETDCDFFWGGPNGNRPKWGQCMNSCGKCRASGGGTCFSATLCENGPNFCFCTDTVEGGAGFCASDQFCVNLPTCKTSADCPSGWVCSADTCCTLFGFKPICNPPCTVGLIPFPGAATNGPKNFMS
jgi:hypothetical protein